MRSVGLNALICIIGQDGAYALVLEFYSPFVSIDTWTLKQEKMTKFFGPGVEVGVTQPITDRIELMLVTSPG